jgi:NAD+ synthase
MNKISKWIKKYCKINNIKTLVVGVSGGVDSALVSTLCAETGMETLLLSMPIKQKQDQLVRARDHARWLISKYDNVKFIDIDLTLLFTCFTKTIPEEHQTDLSLANARSRLRMIILYQYASISNGIVVGTGNKVEDFGVGFFTKYGDGGVDISPIADLTKTQVRNLAKELGVSQDIILAAPTDGLWDFNRTDEDQLGASYEELEWAMSHDGNTSNLSDRQKTVLEIYTKLHRANKHKMVKIPTYRNKNND